jgi:hypothetical protein
MMMGSMDDKAESSEAGASGARGGGCGIAGARGGDTGGRGGDGIMRWAMSPAHGGGAFQYRGGVDERRSFIIEQLSTQLSEANIAHPDDRF